MVLTAIGSIGSVQTTLAGWLVNSINENYDVSIKIDRVKTSFLNFNISLTDVLIEDPVQDTIIYASEIKSKLYNLKVIAGGPINLSKVQFEDFKLEINTPKDSSYNYLDQFVQKLSKKEGESSFYMSSDGIELSNGQLKIHNPNVQNPLVFFDSIHIKTDRFIIDQKELKTSIEQLSFNLNDIQLKKASSDFYYSPQQMRFDQLKLQTEGSSLKGVLSMDYDPGAFKDFYNSVTLHLQSEEVLIDLDEINPFKKVFGDGLTAELALNLDGTLNDLNADVQYLNISNTGIRGVFNFQNLFDSNQRFKLVTTIKNLESNSRDLKRILPYHLNGVLPNSFNRMGRIQIIGTTEFSKDQLVSNNNIRTDLGAIYSDIKIDRITDLENAEYLGFISLIDFDLGSYLFADHSFSNTTMDANISGKGFLRSTVNTKAEGLIYNTTYNGYNYSNIELAGLFKNELFDGSINIDDPNCKLEFNGLADLSNDPNEFNYTAHLKEVDLHKLNFVKDSIALFKGEINTALKGMSIDDVVGTINFKNTQYINPETTFNFEDFSIRAEQLSDQQRRISIDSKDIVTGFIEGNFKLLEASKLFKNSMGSLYANYIPHSIAKGQEFQFNFRVYNKLVEVFLPQLQFAPNTLMKGEVVADLDDFKIDFKSPSVHYNNTVLDSVVLKIDTKNPLFKSYASVAAVQNNYYNFKDFEIINNNIKDTLFFRTEFSGDDAKKDLYALNFYHTFNENNESVVGLKRSTIKLKGYDWIVNTNNNERNKVVYNPKRDSLQIDRIAFNSKLGERIEVEGYLRDSTQTNIQLRLDQVALKKITPSIDSLALDGKVTGLVSYQQLEKKFYPSSKVSIEDFSVNDFILGKMDVDVLGTSDFENFIINGKIVSDQEEQLRLLGDIKRDDQGNLISNLLASFNGFRLEPFSPLGKNVLHRIRGGLFGNAKIIGDLTNPSMEGELTLSQGGIMFPYLNMDYDFGATQSIVLHDQTFEFENINLRDTSDLTNAFMSGSISHQSFRNWILDLNISTQEDNAFKILDTPYEPKRLYYGQGYFTGTASIKGPTKSLDIAIEGKTAAGTTIKIPIEDAQSVGDYEFINFVERSAIGTVEKGELVENYSGLDLAFNLEVTPEAEVEIVIDPDTGSSLKGTGNGNIYMDINTLGKFNMFGEFVVSTGTYAYKFGGFIDKKFKVNSGGRISWEGDPLLAQLDLEAAYSLYANPAPLLEDPGYTQRIPTDVIVRLNGALENPNIDFDIEFPGTNSVVKSELLYALQDPTVQDRNAFFLLAQGSFVNDATGLNQQAVTGNLLQSASGFLNSILDGNNDKVNFGVSYEQGFLDRQSNLQTDNEIGFSLSTQLSDRVLFNGRLGVPIGGGVTENVVGGDAELQLLLNEDGSLSAKVFNRENEYHQLLLDYQGYTQGVGLTYRVDFNSMSELVRKFWGQQNKTSKIDK